MERATLDFDTSNSVLEREIERPWFRHFIIILIVANALAFAAQVRNQPNAVLLQPGNRHWEIFTDLCTIANVKGNLVPDAFLAALAMTVSPAIWAGMSSTAKRGRTRSAAVGATTS